MRIWTGERIRQADRDTIGQEPVSSLDLMERASEALAAALRRHIARPGPVLVAAGKGNNAGDGLAVARMLASAGYACEVWLAFSPEEMTPETAENLRRLPEEVAVRRAAEALEAGPPPEGSVLVDALCGTGVRGPLREPLASLVHRFNGWAAAYRVPVYAVDLPSGLPTEPGVPSGPVLRADRTLTVAFPKLSLLLPETGAAAGALETIPLDLCLDGLSEPGPELRYADRDEIRARLHRADEFAHKGTGGHALLLGGSSGMAGAILLAAGGALRSGCGLVTVRLPEAAAGALLQRHPSAMCSPEPASWCTTLPDRLERFSAIGIGPGLGTRPETGAMLDRLLDRLAEAVPAQISAGAGKTLSTPRLLLDADALNLLAAEPARLDRIPPGSVLTPHLGELRRLTGPWTDARDRIRLARELAVRTRSCVVVKGAHTMVTAPDGTLSFNATGNPGMAKGGSGDVLAGLVTGLLAAGYEAWDAARIGVWLHGTAGDLAARRLGTEGMNAADLYGALGGAWKRLKNKGEF